MNFENDNQNQNELNQEETVSTVTTPAEESYKEQLLRLNADFANYKRRTEKDRAEWMINAQGLILEKILPIFDELDQALTLTEKKEITTDAAWLTGFKLIQKNWQKTFTDLGIEEIAPTGAFDPMLHEALVQIDDASKDSGAIAQTFSKGYRFKGKVIRHAKVSVVK